jgi:hypothetical protein
MKTMKTLIPAGALALAVLLALAWQTALAQEDNLIRTEPFGDLDRPAVIMTWDVHDAHMTYEVGAEPVIGDCNECHHVYEDGEFVEDDSSEGIPCADCHTLEGDGESSVPLAEAYHQNCWGCHEDAGQGPIMCGQCHVR